MRQNAHTTDDDDEEEDIKVYHQINMTLESTADECYNSHALSNVFENALRVFKPAKYKNPWNKHMAVNV